MAFDELQISLAVDQEQQHLIANLGWGQAIAQQLCCLTVRIEQVRIPGEPYLGERCAAEHLADLDGDPDVLVGIRIFSNVWTTEGDDVNNCSGDDGVRRRSHLFD